MFFMLSPAPHSCLQSLCACQFVCVQISEGDGRKERLMGYVKEGGRGREREEGRKDGREEGRWIYVLPKGYCSFWNEWSLSTVGTSWRPQDSGGSEGHGRMRLQRTLGKNLCYEESKRWGHDGKMGIWGEYELRQDQGGRARIYKHRTEEYLWCSSAQCIYAWPLHYLYSDIKYKQYLGFLERRGQDVRREEKVHNVTNNNDCIALNEIRILYVDNNTVVMMKWIHKMMEWCSCQVRVCSIPWKTFLSTKVQTLIHMFSTRTVSMLITMNQMLRRTLQG